MAITKLAARGIDTLPTGSVLQDVSMTQDMTNYRQALRDLPSGLSTVEDVEAVTWPTKP
jgi:hypothetical protein